jgi:hypothetical protein
MVAASKQAAGLPADWGTTPTPLSAEEDLEDAPRPPRLRSGMTTAELLPYGEVVRTPDGQDLVVERLTSPPLQAPGGRIAVCDPISIEWQGQPLQLTLKGDVLPVELAAVRRLTPRGEVVQGAVAVVGDPSAVTSWVEFPMPDTRVSIDQGCGAFIARDQVAEAVALAEGLALSAMTSGLVTVEIGGGVAGVLFDPGDRPGDYEVLLGRGRGALPIALLVDLRVLPR